MSRFDFNAVAELCDRAYDLLQEILSASRTIDSTIRSEGDYDDGLARRIGEMHSDVRRMRDELVASAPVLAVAYHRAGTQRIFHDVYEVVFRYTHLMQYVHHPPAEDVDGFYQSLIDKVNQNGLFDLVHGLTDSFLGDVSIEQEKQLQAAMDTMNVLVFENRDYETPNVTERPTESNKTNSAKKKGRTPQEIKGAAYALIKEYADQGKPITSLRQLAYAVGCSPSGIAIKQVWEIYQKSVVKRGAPKTQRYHDGYGRNDNELEKLIEEQSKEDDFDVDFS